MILRRALQLKCEERRHMWLSRTGMIHLVIGRHQEQEKEQTTNQKGNIPKRKTKLESLHPLVKKR
jgi:hypothetical protein